MEVDQNSFVEQACLNNLMKLYHCSTYYFSLLSNKTANFHLKSLVQSLKKSFEAFCISWINAYEHLILLKNSWIYFNHSRSSYFIVQNFSLYSCILSFLYCCSCLVFQKTMALAFLSQVVLKMDQQKKGMGISIPYINWNNLIEV